MKTPFYTKALFAAAAASVSLLGIGTAANAQDRITRSVAVQYGDLDLTSAAGRDTLDGRIAGAVRKVCGTYDTKRLQEVADHSQCVTEAKASARRASVQLVASAEAGTLRGSAIVVGGQ